MSFFGDEGGHLDQWIKPNNIQHEGFTITVAILKVILKLWFCTQSKKVTKWWKAVKNIMPSNMGYTQNFSAYNKYLILALIRPLHILTITQYVYTIHHVRLIRVFATFIINRLKVTWKNVCHAGKLNLLPLQSWSCKNLCSVCIKRAKIFLLAIWNKSARFTYCWTAIASTDKLYQHCDI